MHKSSALGLVGLVGLGCLGVSGCRHVPPASENAPSPSPALLPTPIPVSNARAETHQPPGALPQRVWWRAERSPASGPFVSDRPGGERIPGEWRAQYFCNLGSRPSALVRLPVSAATDEARYDGRAVWTVRDDRTWWLMTKGAVSGAQDAVEEATILGRWSHRENGFEAVVDLLPGGAARTTDGEVWEWTSAFDCLELQRPDRGASLVLGCTLSADRRSYSRDPDVSGTRLSAPEGPR